MSDVADRRRPLREAGDCAERHYGVADVVHVHVDAVKRVAVNRQRVCGALDSATHLFKNLDEAHIALQRTGA